MVKIWLSLNVHVELHNLPENLPFLSDVVVPVLYDKFGVQPTFFVQSEPKECRNVDLFRDYPEIVKKLSKYGEIGLHSHFIHNKEPHHQRLHVTNALKQAKEYNPVSWASGDWLADEDTLKILEEEEIAIDSSILPQHANHPWTSPRIPYYPNRDNVHKPVSFSHVNPSQFRVVEVPNTPRIRISRPIPDMQNITESTIREIEVIRKEIPIVIPCHSWDFLTIESFWNLQGYLLWLTETYDVKMVTARDFLNYPALRSEEYKIHWDDVKKDIMYGIWKISRKFFIE